MELEKLLQCPFCFSTAELTIKQFKHIPKGKDYLLFGEWYIYECINCKETFTSTESDTLSMKNLKQKKL